jgi:hypothetical protein
MVGMQVKPTSSRKGSARSRLPKRQVGGWHWQFEGNLQWRIDRSMAKGSSIAKRTGCRSCDEVSLGFHRVGTWRAKKRKRSRLTFRWNENIMQITTRHARAIELPRGSRRSVSQMWAARRFNFPRRQGLKRPAVGLYRRVHTYSLLFQANDERTGGLKVDGLNDWEGQQCARRPQPRSGPNDWK